MKKRTRYKVLGLMLLIGVYACSESTENHDKESPKISDIKLSATEVALGDTLYLEYTFTDNDYLSAYRVKIDSTFSNVDTAKTLYRKTLTGSFISEDKQRCEKIDTIIIPKKMQPLGGTASLPIAIGDYKVEISCIDRAGNTVSRDTLITLLPAKEEEEK